jgi:hypothetical protein
MIRHGQCASDRLATASAPCSLVSRAIFWVSITSPATREPSGAPSANGLTAIVEFHEVRLRAVMDTEDGSTIATGNIEMPTLLIRGELLWGEPILEEL